MSVRTAVVCSGLGSIRRGFETFSDELFRELAAVDDSVWLLHGAGSQFDHPNAVGVGGVRRNTSVAKLAGRLWGRDAYSVEQITFAIGAFRRVRELGVEVVVCSDPGVAGGLFRLRKWWGGRFRLLFSNGGPFDSRALPPCDHIQQVTPMFYEAAINAGVPDERMTMLPYGFDVRALSQGGSSTVAERAQVRRECGVEEGRRIILSVGAINCEHKRVDYLINEVSALDGDRRPFLLVLGNVESETEQLVAMAQAKLGERGFAFRCVAADEVPRYMRAADGFVLASLREGFGRAAVEAGICGLRCLVHDYDVMRFVLGEFGCFVDMRVAGALAAVLQSPSFVTVHAVGSSDGTG